jgi:thymidylate synthase
MLNFNKQYLKIVHTVLREGEYVTGRNSPVLQYFCPESIVVKNVSREFPILSVRKIPFYKSALETFFFLGGESSYKSMPELLRNSWWKPWDQQAKEQGSWGKFYGSQWRHASTDQSTNKTEFDQWKNLTQDLCQVVKTGVVNRKMVVSLWRRQDAMSEYTISPAVLDCCHSTSLVFNLVPKWHKDDLANGYAPYQEYMLDLHHTQRSLDLMCGTGADLIYSGLLMHLLCDEVENQLYDVNNPYQSPKVTPRKLIFSPSNAHIYSSHIEQAKQLLMLNSNVLNYQPVKLQLRGPITDFSSFKTIEDVKQVVQLDNYQPNWGNYKFELLG